MKKSLIILLACLALTACETKPIESTTSESTPTTTPDSNVVFNSIQEAVTKAIGIECVYTDPEDGEQVKVYFKGDVVGLRAGANSEQKDFAGLIQDNKIYMWDEVKKGEGILIDLAKVEADSTLSVAGKQIKSTNDVITAMEPYKSNCQPTTETSVFDLPSDVTFN